MRYCKCRNEDGRGTQRNRTRMTRRTRRGGGGGGRRVLEVG